MHEYKGPNPCPKCDGQRGDWRKGYHWTRPADDSTPWWPSEPCNQCGGTGKAGTSYVTVEELVERNRAKFERMKRKLQSDLDHLNAMKVA